MLTILNNFDKIIQNIGYQHSEDNVALKDNQQSEDNAALKMVGMCDTKNIQH